MNDVSLVLLPYANIEHPSLALGLLKAALVRSGISTRVHYLNLLFAEMIGLRRYHFISESPTGQPGEWTFARHLFGAALKDPEEYLEQCSKRLVRGQVLLGIGEQVPLFLERATERVLATEPAIVGCSSTFQQSCASLALLQRIKEQRPEVVTMLGGASCEGSMGLAMLREFPWLDYVVSGDADELLPGLCRRVLDGERSIGQDELPPGVFGPQARASGSTIDAGRATVVDLDLLPYPDYDDYFSELAELSIADSIEPGLPFETSRGCWWGQKQQCIFCGLNGSSLGYRDKSSARARNELAYLSGRHGIKKLQAVDPIMPMQQRSPLLQELAAEGAGYNLFYETVASLTRKQVAELAAAGVRCIQPGIESLHDGPLGLMSKGTRAWKNLQLLKWCAEHGITVLWGHLNSIPGERIEWYEEVIEWLPKIFHLQPPCFFGPIRYDRFSPLVRDPEQFGLELVPAWYYPYLYPLPADRLHEIVYFFEDTAADNRRRKQQRDPVFERLRRLMVEWQELYTAPRAEFAKRDVAADRPRLLMEGSGKQLHLTDTRPCAREHELHLDGLAAQVYQVCDAAKSLEMITRALAGTTQVTDGQLRQAVGQLVELQILLPIHGRYLSLAVRHPSPEPLPIEERPNGFVRIPRLGNAVKAAVTGSERTR